MTRPPSSLLPVIALIALAACVSDDTTAPAAATASPSEAQPALAAVTSNSWTTGAPMTQDWVDFGAAAINNSQDQPVVYVLGGVTANRRSMNIQVFTYNAATNIWVSKNINNDGAIFRARGNGVARVNNVLYITGGLDLVPGFGDNDINSLVAGTDAYKTSTNSLVPAAEFPERSADGVSGVINGKLYVLIGSAVVPGLCGPDGCPPGTVRELYRYDPTANAWVTRKAPPHYHRSGAGGVINGKFYVVGGFDSKGNATRNLDVYNPATNSWTTQALLPKASTDLKATVLQNKLYVVSPTATYAYTPSTNSWAQKATGPAGSAAGVEGGAAVTVTLNGKERMIVVGGKRTVTGALPKTAIYTP